MTIAKSSDELISENFLLLLFQLLCSGFEIKILFISVVTHHPQFLSLLSIHCCFKEKLENGKKLFKIFETSANIERKEETQTKKLFRDVTLFVIRSSWSLWPTSFLIETLWLSGQPSAALEGISP